MLDKSTNKISYKRQSAVSFVFILLASLIFPAICQCNETVSLPGSTYTVAIVPGLIIITLLAILWNITLRRTVRQKTMQLAQSKSDYRTIVENVDFGIALIDNNHNIVMSNEACGDIFGKPATNFLGRKCFFEFERTKDICSHCPGQVALKTGKPSTTTTTLIRGDGSCFDARIRAFPTFTSDGQSSGFIEMIEDISRHKHAETALQESELYTNSLLRLSTALEQARDYDSVLGVVCFEIEQVIGYQTAWFYLFKESRESAILVSASGSGSKIITEEISGLELKGDDFLKEIMNSDEPVIVEDARVDPRTNKAIVNKLGNRSIINIPIKMMDMRLGVIGTGSFLDEGVRLPSYKQLAYLESMAKQLAISLDRLRFFEQSQNMIERLQTSERQLSSLLDAAPDAIVAVDSQGLVLWWNRSAEGIFGLRAHEIIGNPVTTIVPQQFRGAHTPGFKEAARSGAMPKAGKIIEASGLRQNGEEFPIELSLATWTEVGARYFIAIIRDISARKQVEEQYLQAQKMEAVGRLTGGVAHDFNNILTSIIGYSQLALMDTDNSAPLYETLTIIRDAGHRAADLTRQLLAFSRKQVLETGPVVLNDAIEYITKLLSKTIGEDIKISYYLCSNEQVMADKGQIEQVLMNLAVNARDAMPDGGQLTFETYDILFSSNEERESAEIPPGHYCLLVVSDTGCGMDTECMKHIFDPFYTTKGLEQGTGLGLAIVQGVIHQHQGHIFVESKQGKGTTFKIYLPTISETDINPVVPLDDQKMLTGTETILVVDDDGEVRKTVCDILSRFGYKCLVASCGNDACQLDDETVSEVDLLLTDVIMPDMKGTVLASNYQKRLPGIKTVFMSGYADDTISKHGILTPGIHFLQKPLFPDVLLKKIRLVLDQE